MTAAPISPELVLVDPDLARAARAALPDRPDDLVVARPARTLPAPVLTPAPRPAPRRLRRGGVRLARALSVSVLVLLAWLAGFAASALLDRGDTGQAAASAPPAAPPPLSATVTRAAPRAAAAPKPAPRPPTTTAVVAPPTQTVAPPTQAVAPTATRAAEPKPVTAAPNPVTARAPARTAPPRQVTSRKAPAVKLPSRGDVEQAVLLSLLERDPRLLPADLREPGSGLLKQSVQAVCRLIDGSREFSCRVAMDVRGAGKTWGASYVVGPRGEGEVRWDPPRTRRR